jgi:hypothetical protein
MKDIEDFDKRNDSVVVLSVEIRRPTSTEIVGYPFSSFGRASDLQQRVQQRVPGSSPQRGQLIFSWSEYHNSFTGKISNIYVQFCKEKLPPVKSKETFF